MNTEPPSSDVTMIFGMKVKVEKHQKKSKAYISIGLLCMLLSLFFHVVEVSFQSEYANQHHPGEWNLSMELWYRTCSGLSFICLWIAVLMLFQSVLQQRKALSAANL
jgi:hypothetical protein